MTHLRTSLLTLFPIVSCLLLGLPGVGCGGASGAAGEGVGALDDDTATDGGVKDGGKEDSGDAGEATDAATPPDSGATSDAGKRLDAGEPTDGGEDRDAEPSTDGGNEHDAGPSDSGAPTDGGETSDAAPALTWTTIYEEAFAPGTPGHCGNSGCHGTIQAGFLCGTTAASCLSGMISKGLLSTTDPTASTLGSTTASPLRWVHTGGPMPLDNTTAEPQLGADIEAWVKKGAPGILGD